MKKKVLLSSIATIALCFSLIVGSTLALFTSTSTNDISVEAATVKMSATINDLTLWSADASAKKDDDTDLIDENGNRYGYVDMTTTNGFINGGSAKLDGAVLTLNQITPGDKVEFDIVGENESNVAIQYRYKIQCVEGDNLMKGFDVEINDTEYSALKSYVCEWKTLAVGTTMEKVPVVIELPITAGNEYQGLTAKISIVVEAIQGNAVVSNAEAEIVKYEGNATKFTGTSDELVEALESQKDVILTDDVKIEPANMSNAYGTTGINVKNGQTIDGNGNILDIEGAGGTWDSGISTTGGLIKNITITGSFRGIFINHNSTHAERVILENVILDGTVYTISCDQGKNQGLTATNSTFNGWTSYAATLGDAEFINCFFGEGRGYAYCRPYAPTKFVGCDFEAGFVMDPRAAVTFENCTIGGVALTAANLKTLVTSNSANATVIA